MNDTVISYRRKIMKDLEKDLIEFREKISTSKELISRLSDMIDKTNEISEKFKDVESFIKHAEERFTKIEEKNFSSYEEAVKKLRVDHESATIQLKEIVLTTEKFVDESRETIIDTCTKLSQDFYDRYSERITESERFIEESRKIIKVSNEKLSQDLNDKYLERVEDVKKEFEKNQSNFSGLKNDFLQLSETILADSNNVKVLIEKQYLEISTMKNNLGKHSDKVNKELLAIVNTLEQSNMKSSTNFNILILTNVVGVLGILLIIYKLFF
jgi:Txe/YoeB family toxin of Txe-Axe toxin-antitoxin module